MADSISPIVRRYFESFFDSVDFYHEMVRDEIETTRKDVAELYGMVPIVPGSWKKLNRVGVNWMPMAYLER